MTALEKSGHSKSHHSHGQTRRDFALTIGGVRSSAQNEALQPQLIGVREALPAQRRHPDTQLSRGRQPSEIGAAHRCRPHSMLAIAPSAMPAVAVGPVTASVPPPMMRIVGSNNDRPITKGRCDVRTAMAVVASVPARAATLGRLRRSEGGQRHAGCNCC